MRYIDGESTKSLEAFLLETVTLKRNLCDEFSFLS